MLLFAATAATIEKKAFPKPLAIPIVLGGFALGYLYDFAYGSKMLRVRQEAEYILEKERERLIPPKSMPSRKFWETEASALLQKPPVKRVGEIWPTW
jgi:hypothetical protein